jgi:activating signal cointegrator 1
MAVGLSIRQPWVELILLGRKTIEVRTWTTNHRGKLWLHAGKVIDVPACNAHAVSWEGLNRGELVGICELKDCVEFDECTWETLRPRHLNFGPFTAPRFAWMLAHVRRVPATPLRGALRLMRLPDRFSTEGREERRD